MKREKQILNLLTLLASSAAAGATQLPIAEENSALHRWQQKEVHDRVVLGDMEEGKSAFRIAVNATGEYTREKAHGGDYSLKIVLPERARTDDSYADGTGNFGWGGIDLELGGVDWSDYNRLSVWVYPVAPALDQMGFDFGINSPHTPYEASPKHAINARTGQWNHLVWELGDRPLDQIQSISFYYGLSGRKPGTGEFVFYIDDFELQRVEPEYVEGWEVGPGKISFSHSGYEPGSEKVAFTSSVKADTFELLQCDKVVYTGVVEHLQTSLGTFQKMDFTEFRVPGSYRLRVGALETRPFKISRDLWRDSIEKVLSFYYSERCGQIIPGIHEACHPDVWTEHNGQKIRSGGAWHDAGDLTLPPTRIAESDYAMFQLYETLKNRPGYSDLAERTLEEALYGLEWIMRLSFRDGWRSEAGIMRFYTDGIDDNYDDIQFKATDFDPFVFLLNACVEATAARIMSERDPGLAERALEMAVEDFKYGIKQLNDPRAINNRRFYLPAMAAGVQASVDLWKALNDDSYLETGAGLADRIVALQQQEVPNELEIDLKGWFYQTPRREESQNYGTVGVHGHQMEALMRISDALPDHPHRTEWENSAKLFVEDYILPITEYTAPYYVIPNGVYDADFWAKSRFPEVVDYLKEGWHIGGSWYLRAFQPQGQYSARANLGTRLAMAKAVSSYARHRKPELVQVTRNQLHWTVGRNPFSQSLMTGEGYDFTPYYTPQIGDAAGALPVGIKMKFNRDVPYFPATSRWNYKEVFIHPTSLWLWIMADIMADKD